MTSTSLSDNDAQQRLVSDFQTTFLLEAGAGTGKTQLLLNRLLALLRTGRPLSRVAVITFTEKAAAELRTRLRAAVESALQTTLPEAERAALQTVLSELDRATVMTIHAFCAALLRERALEVGLDPAFTVLNQAEAGRLHDQVWQAWLAQELQSGTDSAPLIRQAFRAGLSVTHLKALCDFLVEQRDCLDWLPASIDARLPDSCAELQAAVVRLTTLRDCCHDPTDSAFKQITNLVDSVPTASYQDHAAAWEHLLLHRLTVQPRRGKQTNWQSTAALDEVRTLLARFKALHLKTRSAWLHNLTVGLAGWLGGYLRAYQAKKQHQGQLDFLDLLVLMRDGLKHKRELRRYFQRKFDFLLVDEVQDIDPLQAEIVFFLAEDQPRTADWTQVALRAGKLFLVGDPQQSIYRFRRADLEVYQLLRSAIERQGSVLGLSTNFRMRAALMGWMNNTFSRVLDNADDPDQPAYLPLRPAGRDEHEPPAGPTVFLLDLPHAAPHERAGPDGLRDLEAGCTVRFLRQTVENKTLTTQAGQPLRYGDIALLCRTNRGVEIYEKALQEAQLPYRSTGAQRATTSRERTEVQACVRTLVHPADATALVATLRSPLFGFSDEELTQFRCAGGAFDYLGGSVPAQLPCADRFQAAFALLRSLHKKLSRTVQSAPGVGAGLAAVLAEIHTHTPVLPLFAGRPHGQRRLHILLRRVEALRELSGHGAAQDFSPDFFDRLLASALDESDEGQTEPAGVLDAPQDALHVLTIHKAKGLEFPLVVVAESGAPANRLTRRGLVSRKEARLELHIGSRSLHCCTLGWQQAEAREREREAAEEKRLWYVAATRAREYVVFPLRLPSDEKKRDPANELQTVLRDLSAGVPHPAQHSVRMEVGQTDRLAALPNPAGAQEKLPEKEAAPDASPASADARPSDIDWFTDRRRLIAKGRRTRQTHKETLREQVSPRQARLDRLMTQTALQVRQGIKASRQAPANGPLPDATHNAIAQAAIWPRVRRAQKWMLHEAFALHSDKTVLTGRIPLAFLEGEKWFIADFFPGEGMSPGKERGLTYDLLGPGALALEQLTPFPVRDLLLFVVDRQQEIRVAWESPGKDALRKKLLG